MKPLSNSNFHRYFLSVEFFRDSHSVHIWWNPREVWSFIDIFWVWNFSEFHTYYIHDETLEKFGLSSRFSECGIFQRSILSTFRWNPWKLWSFFNIFWKWNLSEVHTWFKLDENFEKFGLPSRFSECGIFPRSILSTFRWNSWEVWFFIDIFCMWNFLEVHT